MSMWPIVMLIVLSGCAPRAMYMALVEEEHSAKSSADEVTVFLNDERPEREYVVIGLIYVEVKPDRFGHLTPTSSVVRQFRTEARKHGADAVIDIRIDTEGQLSGVFDWESTLRPAQAKAIVYVDDDAGRTE